MTTPLRGPWEKTLVRMVELRGFFTASERSAVEYLAAHGVDRELASEILASALSKKRPWLPVAQHSVAILRAAGYPLKRKKPEPPPDTTTFADKFMNQEDYLRFVEQFQRFQYSPGSTFTRGGNGGYFSVPYNGA